MKRIFSLMFLTLCACTPAPQAAMDGINREFAGRDANDFFVDFGMPAGSQATSLGTSYRWLSLEPHGGGRAASAITYPGGHFGAIGGSANGEMMSGYCEIRIDADSRERIKKITIVADSIGKYSGSRCAEIFEQSPN